MITFGRLTGQSSESHLRKEVSKIIKFESGIDFELTPEFLVLVMDGDYEEVLCFQSESSQSPCRIDEGSIFELGSISKTITSQILLGLERDGILSTTDKLNDLIPQEYVNPRLKDFIISDILNLNSPLPNIFQGMGFYEADASNPFEQLSKTRLLEFYHTYFPESSGHNPSMGDVDFALLEIAMEHVTGKSYDELLDQYINEPFECHFFTTAYEKRNEVVTEGLNRSGLPGEAYQFKSFAGSVGVKGSLKDLSKLVKHWLRADVDGIGKDSFRQLPVTWTSKVRVSDGFYLMDVGRGKYPKMSNGLTNIHHSFIAMLPQTKTAVISLAASGTSIEDVGLLVLRMVNNNWKRKH